MFLPQLHFWAACWRRPASKAAHKECSAVVALLPHQPTEQMQLQLAQLDLRSQRNAESLIQKLLMQEQEQTDHVGEGT